MYLIAHSLTSVFSRIQILLEWPQLKLYVYGPSRKWTDAIIELQFGS